MPRRYAEERVQSCALFALCNTLPIKRLKTPSTNQLTDERVLSLTSLVTNWSCSAPRRYWADIDTRLRRVAYEKRVKVRLLISCWGSSKPVMFPFLRSLASVYDPKSRLDIQVVSISSCVASSELLCVL